MLEINNIVPESFNPPSISVSPIPQSEWDRVFDVLRQEFPVDVECEERLINEEVNAHVRD
jgi:hypothetical protein